jgi:hypothetical protein
VDLSSGSRTPIATETAPDEVNIVKGEWYLLYDAEVGGGFAIDNVIQNTSTSSGVPPTWYAEVTAVTSWGGTAGILTLRTLRGTIADNDAIYVGTTQRGVANGTPGDTYTTYVAEAVTPVVGLVMTGGTSGAKRILRGKQDDGTTGKLVLAVQHDHSIVSGSSRSAYYKDFTTGETITDSGTGSVTHYAGSSTTLISGYSDITVIHVNGTVVASNFVGTFQPGERVTWNAGASSAYLVATNGSNSITLGNVTDEPDAADSFTGQRSGATADCDSGLTDANTTTFAFTQQSAYAYSVMVECGSIYNTGRTLSDVYGYLQYICGDGKGSDVFYTSTGAAIVQVARERYIKSVSSYTATKPAPFGTLAGSLFFGAQGIWLQGQASADANNVRLLDHTGTLQTPYTSVVVSVGNTRVDDWITVFLKGGSTSLPDKAQYTSHNVNNVQGDSTFERDATNFPIDTPASGSFTVVDASANEEHRYRYTSWTTTSLTLPTKRTGSATAGSTGQTLIAAAATFVTWGIQRGDIIRNTTDGGWGYVVTVDSETQLTTTQLTTAGKDWANVDGFELNALVVTYVNTDKFFIPYIDVLEDVGTDGTPGSASVTILYLMDRAVVIRARNVRATTKIQPFVTTSTVTSGGMAASVIRNPDTVFS